MKGISAIIATVLLVAFTVAVAGILSIWSTTLTTTQTQTVSNQTGGQVICSPAIVIDEAKVPSTGNYTLNITYRNAGVQPITNVKVWARTVSGMYSVSGTALSGGDVSVTGLTLLSVGGSNASSDLVRVTGLCASVVVVSADCLPTNKCWKAA